MSYINSSYHSFRPGRDTHSLIHPLVFTDVEVEATEVKWFAPSHTSYECRARTRTQVSGVTLFLLHCATFWKFFIRYPVYPWRVLADLVEEVHQSGWWSSVSLSKSSPPLSSGVGST